MSASHQHDDVTFNAVIRIQNQIENKHNLRTFAFVLLSAIALAACSRDGRVLRDSGPGQGESIAIVTTPADPNLDTESTAVAENLFSVRKRGLIAAHLIHVTLVKVQTLRLR